MRLNKRLLYARTHACTHACAYIGGLLGVGAGGHHTGAQARQIESLCWKEIKILCILMTLITYYSSKSNQIISLISNYSSLQLKESSSDSFLAFGMKFSKVQIQIL